MILNLADHPEQGSFLQARVPAFEFGERFRVGDAVDDEGGIQAELDPYNIANEPVASFYLQHTEGAYYTAKDYSLSTLDTHVYILDNADGANGSHKIHIHEIDLTSFSQWSLARTADTTIDVLPLKHRSYLGETMSLWTWHRELKSPVVGVKIKRETPAEFALAADGAFHGKYLQADLTWGAAEHTFSGTPFGGLPEDTWSDIKFSTDFNEVGQWNFYCEATLFENEMQRSCTAVM